MFVCGGKNSSMLAKISAVVSIFLCVVAVLVKQSSVVI